MTTESEVVVPTDPLEAVRVAHGTDIGRRREENQDNYGIIEGPGYKLFIVCDGMGGVKGGAVASSIAVETIRAKITEKQTLTEESLVEAVQAANTAIFEKGSQDSSLTGMGTTFVGIGFVGTSMIIANVGDSRAYRVRNGIVEQLTEDHTLVMELVRSGAITEEQAGNHPVSHMLTRSLGPTPNIEVDCWTSAEGPARGDLYLLCSDGLYNMVGPEEFLEILQTCTIEASVQELIELANLRGGSDNITIIISELTDSYPTVYEPPPEVEEPAYVQSTTVELDDIVVAGDDDQSAVNGSALDPRQAVLVEEKVNGHAESDLHEHLSIQELQKDLTPEEPSVGEAAAAEQTAVATPQRRWSPPPWFMAAVVGVVALAVGWGVRGTLPSGSTSTQTPLVVAPAVRAAEVARVSVQENKSLLATASEPRLPSISLDPSLSSGGSAALHSEMEAPTQHGLTEEELTRLVKRKGVLRTQIATLQEKIASFDRPFSGKAGQILADASRRTDEMKSELGQVRAEIDIATRRLAVWFGRRKRLLTTEPINLASEVAVVSPVVKEKKEEFERVTWAYLKEAEVLRYNPNDREQEQRVSELVRDRKEAMRFLAEEVRKAIDREVADADRRISELTLRRDAVDNQLEELRREVEYVRVLTGGDENARSAKRAELERERQSAQAELDELRIVVPE